MQISLFTNLFLISLSKVYTFSLITILINTVTALRHSYLSCEIRRKYVFSPDMPTAPIDNRSGNCDVRCCNTDFPSFRVTNSKHLLTWSLYLVGPAMFRMRFVLYFNSLYSVDYTLSKTSFLFDII